MSSESIPKEILENTEKRLRLRKELLPGIPDRIEAVLAGGQDPELLSDLEKLEGVNMVVGTGTETSIFGDALHLNEKDAKALRRQLHNVFKLPSQRPAVHTEVDISKVNIKKKGTLSQEGKQFLDNLDILFGRGAEVQDLADAPEKEEILKQWRKLQYDIELAEPQGEAL